jgi:hypothetical protein
VNLKRGGLDEGDQPVKVGDGKRGGILRLGRVGYAQDGGVHPLPFVFLEELLARRCHPGSAEGQGGGR